MARPSYHGKFEWVLCISSATFCIYPVNIYVRRDTCNGLYYEYTWKIIVNWWRKCSKNFHNKKSRTRKTIAVVYLGHPLWMFPFGWSLFGYLIGCSYIELAKWCVCRRSRISSKVNVRTYHMYASHPLLDIQYVWIIKLRWL